MKKRLIFAAFSILTIGLGSPASALDGSCKSCAMNSKGKCTHKTVVDVVAEGGITTSPIMWKSMSLEAQKKFCNKCGHTHVKKWSGNYCKASWAR